MFVEGGETVDFAPYPRYYCYLTVAEAPVKSRARNLAPRIP